MEFKDLLANIIHDITLEGIGLLFSMGILLYLLFGGGFGDIFVLFSKVFCG